MNDALLKALKRVIDNSSMGDDEKEALKTELENSSSKSKEEQEKAANNAKKNAGELMNAITAYNKVIEESIYKVDKARQAEISTLKEEMKAKIEAGTISEQELLIQKERIARLQVEAEAAKRAGNAFKRFLDNQGFGKNLEDSFTGKMLLSGGKGFANLAEEMKRALQPQALFASGLLQMEKATMQLFTAFDSAQANLSKVTATTGQYNDMLYDMQESNKTFGVDANTASEAIGSMHKNLSSFNQMSAQTQQALATTTARMKVLGVDTETGAKQFDNMIQGMGMTTVMANNASLELVNLGDAIGVSADIISNQFNQASAELAKYGTDAIKVFKGMSAAAKATGVEMNTLMSITKQYDTFEGAATAAGKLNAILGGGVVNSMDLLNATEDERIRLLIKSIELSGKNYENLNRFEKQAIASAAGISDMAEANKILSMSTNAYDDMQAKASGANAEAAKLEERAQAAQTFQQKMTQIGQAFAVAFMPVLDFMHGFANLILELNDLTGGYFIPVMVGLAGVLALVWKAGSVNNAILKAQSAIMATQTFVVNTLAAAKTMYAGREQFLTSVKAAGSLQDKMNIALDYMGVTSTVAKTVATEGEAVAASTATVANAGLATSLTALIGPLIPLTPLIAGLGMAMLGLGLAIAAPFIALAVITLALRDVFIAMLEAPKAIDAAIVGIMKFAVAGTAAIIILSTGILIAAAMLSGAAPMMLMIAPALAAFAGAMLIAAIAFYVGGMALGVFAEGLAAFGDVSWEALAIATVSLVLFALGMIQFAPMLSLAMALVGVPLLIFGIALKLFAEGLVEFNNVGWEAMAKATLSLAVFAIALILLAPVLGIAAAVVGIPLMALGLGLLLFAKGLAEFNKVGWTEIGFALLSLTLLGLGITALTVPLGIGASIVGLSLLAFGLGLIVFAKALQQFNKIGFAEIFKAVLALGLLAVALIPITATLGTIGFVLPLSLAAIAFGLGALGIGLRQFNEVGIDAIFKSITALVLLSVALSFLVGAGWLQVAAAGFLLLGMSLIVFGAGIMSVGAGLDVLAGAFNKFQGVTHLFEILMESGVESISVLYQMAEALQSIALALFFLPESKVIGVGYMFEGLADASNAISALSPAAINLGKDVVTVAGEYAEVQSKMKSADQDSFVQALKSALGIGAQNQGKGKDIVIQLNGRELGRAVDAELNKRHSLRTD